MSNKNLLSSHLRDFQDYKVLGPMKRVVKKFIKFMNSMKYMIKNKVEQECILNNQLGLNFMVCLFKTKSIPLLKSNF